VATQELGVTAVRKGAAGEDGEGHEFTPESLLADARRFAAGDQTMIDWANAVERALSVSVASTRGAVGGPKRGQDILGPRSSDSYTVAFVGGQLAQVYVCGSGTTDLDLYVYDQNGNLIGYDEGYTDECFLQWVPRWTGNFILEVRNLGSYANRYVIATN
jgi:hypothetical protein